MHLNKKHLMIAGGVFGLPLVLVFLIYCYIWGIQPLYVYNPLPIHFPMTPNLIQSDQTVSVPRLFKDIDKFIHFLKKTRFKDYDISIQGIRIHFLANNHKIEIKSGNSVVFF